jgi:hypothetical protein
MTTLNETREAVYLAFVNGWSTTTEIVLGTEDFDEEGADEYIRLSVKQVASKQSSLGQSGNRKFERRAIAFVQVFTTGSDARVDVLMTLARSIFEGVSLAGTTVSFLEVMARETGQDGKFNGGLVEARLRYEEIK